MDRPRIYIFSAPELAVSWQRTPHLGILLRSGAGVRLFLDPSERPSSVVLFSARMTALESLSHALRRREKLILCSIELSLDNYTGKLTFKGTKGGIL